MIRGPRIRRDFFERPCLQVAREMVGCLLVHRLARGPCLVGRLVEVEAYLGNGRDPASHSHKGPTTRNLSMFGPPGRLYAYRSYGIHTCVNLVCEAKGSGAAVLLRAIEPLEGIDTMRELRGLGEEAYGPIIASGPGRLAQAFGFDLSADGSSALSDRLHLTRPRSASGERIVASARIGISRGSELPYRFSLADHPLVTRWRPGKSAAARRR